MGDTLLEASVLRANPQSAEGRRRREHGWEGAVTEGRICGGVDSASSAELYPVRASAPHSLIFNLPRYLCVSVCVCVCVCVCVWGGVLCCVC